MRHLTTFEADLFETMDTGVLANPLTKLHCRETLLKYATTMKVSGRGDAETPAQIFSQYYP